MSTTQVTPHDLIAHEIGGEEAQDGVKRHYRRNVRHFISRWAGLQEALVTAFEQSKEAKLEMFYAYAEMLAGWVYLSLAAGTEENIPEIAVGANFAAMALSFEAMCERANIDHGLTFEYDEGIDKQAVLTELNEEEIATIALLEPLIIADLWD